MVDLVSLSFPSPVLKNSPMDVHPRETEGCPKLVHGVGWKHHAEADASRAESRLPTEPHMWVGRENHPKIGQTQVFEITRIDVHCSFTVIHNETFCRWSSKIFDEVLRKSAKALESPQRGAIAKALLGPTALLGREDGSTHWGSWRQNSSTKPSLRPGCLEIFR